jgi:hypothetical protein
MNTVADRLRRLSQSKIHPQVQGHWMSVSYCPSLLAGESINIGVAFVDSITKTPAAKFLEDLDRISVIFGDHLEAEIRFAIQSLTDSLAQGRLEAPSENLRLSTPRFASGESADAILEDLCGSVVRLLSFAKSPNSPRINRSNEKIRKQVFDSIRSQSGIAAERIIAVTKDYIVRENDREYSLDIPLRGEHHLGSVVSAAYASRQPLENNLFRASLDLETASRIFQRNKLGLFVLRPSSDDPLFVGKKLVEIDNVIDMLEWKLLKQGFTVGVEDDIQRLASRVIDWGEVA